MIRRIVLFKKGIETLWYFSLQLGREFERLGYEIFYFDLCHEYKSFIELLEFCKPGETAVVSFNFNGCSGEEYMYDKFGINFFESRDIPMFNIVVDHPLYYHKFVPYLPKDYTQISIDLEHEEYLKRFFPEIRRGPFLPLAGTSICDGRLPGFEERDIDVVFTGNYNPPENYEDIITRNGEEYADFYRRLIQDFVDHPWLELTTTIEKHVMSEIEDADEEGLKEVMPNMMFIDLYIRHWFRGEAVKALVDGGVKVHVFGAGWDHLPVKNPDNLITHKVIDSRECLEQICRAKISLNVMPWFKRGAHDRVFNSMLNGAICLTDGSQYLNAELSDEEVCFYKLTDLTELPDLTHAFLSNKTKWETTQAAAYAKASSAHTWTHRAKRIHEELLLTI